VSGGELTDEQIQAMSLEERRELIMRLTQATAGTRMPSSRTIERIRKWRLALMLVCVAVLIPWIVYLANTLPNHYVARRWVATWVGFDIILLALLVLTAIFGWRRRMLLFPSAFACGVLLICDAWFDVLTSHWGENMLQALLSAVLVELPLALILIAGPLRLLRSVAIRNGLVDPRLPLWRMPIPVPELWPEGKMPPN